MENRGNTLKIVVFASEDRIDDQQVDLDDRTCILASQYACKSMQIVGPFVFLEISCRYSVDFSWTSQMTVDISHGPTRGWTSNGSCDVDMS